MRKKENRNFYFVILTPFSYKQSIGNVLCDPEFPITVSNHFQGQIVVFSLKRPLVEGMTVEIHYQSLNESAFISKIVRLVDKSTGEAKKKKPR